MKRLNSGWKSIKQLQQAFVGLKPVVAKPVRNEAGEVCGMPQECQARWKRHFEGGLNMTSDGELGDLANVR